MQMQTVKVLCVLLMVAMLVVAGGCKGKKDVPLDTGGAGTDDDGLDTYDAGDDETGTSSLPDDVEIERLLWNPATGLQGVYFDFDSYTLRSDAIAILQENAEKIKRTPAGVLIQVEGHCDERGTQEYNMVLGEKRALAVREYLIKLGISGDRILTISYGEEMPVDPGHSEAAYSQNRRCEFNKAR